MLCISSEERVLAEEPVYHLPHNRRDILIALLKFDQDVL